MPIHLDAETRAVVSLPDCGVHAYMMHPLTQFLCICYTLEKDDEPHTWLAGQPLPRDLHEAILRGEAVHAHNAAFERLLFKHILCKRYDVPMPVKFVCTMAAALAMNLPGALGRAASAVGLPEQKDYDGKAIMLSLSQPVETGWCRCAHRKSDHKILKHGTTCKGCECHEFRRVEAHDIVWRTPDRFPDEHAKMYAYCRQDVRTERALSQRLLALSPEEQRVWELDQEINDRGVETDRAAVAVGIRIAAEEGARLDDELRIVTRGQIDTCGQVAKIAEFCGMEDGLGKDLVEAALSSSGCICGHDIDDHDAGYCNGPGCACSGVRTLTPAQRRVLEIRQEAGRASVKKLLPMRDSLSDGRLRGLFQYHGAFTGRWAGRRVQPQNFPRPNMPNNLIEWVLAQPESRLSPLIARPMDILANAMRGFIVAGKGNVFISADLSQIEARMLAYLAGDQETVEAYRQGKDMYCVEATKILRELGMREEPVTKADTELRQNYGKIPVLACGYQGGANSFVKMGKNYGTDIPPDIAARIVTGYRKAHPEIVKFWYNLEAAAIAAVLNPGQRVSVGRITYRKVGSFLLCKLPSGRVITYPYPRVKNKVVVLKDGRTFTKDVLSYQTVREDSGGMWGRVDTYGGKLCENVVQAASRCVLSDGMLRVTAAGYPIVLHIHDEIVVEVVDTGSAPLLLKFINELMALTPEWAPGLPVASAGWYGPRYRK